MKDLKELSTILNIAKRSPLAECGLTYYNVRNDMEHCIRCLVHESISEYKLGVERLKDRAGDFWVAAATTRINDRLGILSLLQDPFKELPQVCDWKLHPIACHTQFSGRLSLRFGQSSTLHLSQFLWPP